MSSRKLTAIIVDDEPHARDIVKLLLDEEPDIELLKQCEGGKEAIDAINALHPDIVFLDIQMPEVDGFEVIKRVNTTDTQFIFVTAFDEYALKAFEVNAVDYLLKPYDDDRFKMALFKVKQQIDQRDLSAMNERLSSLLAHIEVSESADSGESVTKIPVKTGHRIRFVDVENIDWIEAADQYVKLHVGDQYHLLRESMNTLESKLSSKNFLRIHRSTIINIDRVKELQPYHKGDYVVILTNNKTLRMSRTRKEKLQQMLGW
ncbi:MAG: LytTR family DNA-binding domain-containing protein [Bacteroidota bacterium]